MGKKAVIRFFGAVMMVGGIAIGGLGVRQILQDNNQPQIPVVYDWQNEALGQAPSLEPENQNSNVYVPNSSSEDSAEESGDDVVESSDTVNEEGAGDVDE